MTLEKLFISILTCITLSSPAMAAGEHAHSHHADHRPISQAKLSLSAPIRINQPVRVTIDIQDSKGQNISRFETFQEKLMHLIVVSSNLRFFNHIHPEYKQNGRFEIETAFPFGGTFIAFCDYKPAGHTEQLSVLNIQVPGGENPSPVPEFISEKKIGDTNVAIAVSSPIKSGEETTIIFDLKPISGNQPVSDLQPYLGERGHLVIIRKSDEISAKDYIHAHAVETEKLSSVRFETRFHEAGYYKLFGQFNRNGVILTADFWVKVE